MQESPVTILSHVPKDPQCESVGVAEGVGTSQAKARYVLRERAEEAGADTVVIDAPVQKAPGGRTLLHAELFRCPGPAAGGEALAGGAGWPSPVEQPVDSAPVPASEPAAASELAADEPGNPAPTLEQRLAELKELFEKGLITEQDYEQRRQQLLQEL